MQRTYSYGAALLGAALLLASPSASHAQATETRAVTIAIMDEGYPAFDPAVAQQHPQARPVAAVVIRRYLPDNPISVILLSPEHANVHTLGRAVRALARCPGGTSDAPAPNWVALAPGEPADAAAPQDAPQLAAWLTQLRAQPAADLRHVGGGTGRAIEVEGLQACLAPADQQAERPATQPDR